MQPLFLFTLPRSGSTLLLRVLTRQAESAAVSEPSRRPPLLRALHPWGSEAEQTRTWCACPAVDQPSGAASSLQGNGRGLVEQAAEGVKEAPRPAPAAAADAARRCAEVLTQESDRPRGRREPSEVSNGCELLLLAHTRPEPPLEFIHAARPGVVSVVIPVYNGQSFLRGAVQSVWEQTLDKDRIEILVGDDGSADGSAEAAMELARQSPVPIRVLRHPRAANRGVAATRNLCFRHASGEFIALLDVDDRFLPRRLEAAVAHFAADPQCDTLCSLGWFVDARGARVPGYNGTGVAGDYRRQPEYFDPPFTFDQLWHNGTPIANSSLTMRRAALENVGGYPDLMSHQCEDWVLELKLSLRKAIPCLEEKLMLYTVHPNSYTAVYLSEGRNAGTRLETFFSIVHWMASREEYRARATQLFRKEFARLMARSEPLPGVRAIPRILGRAFRFALRIGPLQTAKVLMDFALGRPASLPTSEKGG